MLHSTSMKARTRTIITRTGWGLLQLLLILIILGLIAAMWTPMIIKWTK